MFFLYFFLSCLNNKYKSQVNIGEKDKRLIVDGLKGSATVEIKSCQDVCSNSIV